MECTVFNEVLLLERRSCIKCTLSWIKRSHCIYKGNFITSPKKGEIYLWRINIYNRGISALIRGWLKGKSTDRTQPRAEALINTIISISHFMALYWLKVYARQVNVGMLFPDRKEGRTLEMSSKGHNLLYSLLLDFSNLIGLFDLSLYFGFLQSLFPSSLNPFIFPGPPYLGLR